jgi:chaperonin GroES
MLRAAFEFQQVGLLLRALSRARTACGLGFHRRVFMRIRPLQDRIVVSRIADQEKTKGGIIIPDTAKEKPMEAKVLAVGNGRILEDGSVRKLDIKVGDRVLFTKYGGSEVTINGEQLLILREDDVLGVVEK